VPLVEQHTFEFPYRRTVGPVVGRFLAGLRDATLIGGKASDGRVFVPPLEWDPSTGRDTEDFVAVGPGAVVEEWTWIEEPRSTHPVAEPFAWALLKPDGADVSSLLHMVVVPSREEMRVGLRVVPRWSDDRAGHIRDIIAFGPEVTRSAAPPLIDSTPVTELTTPLRLEYEYVAGDAVSRMLAGVVEGELRGQPCPRCAAVYMPSTGACPACGVATGGDEVLLPGTGTVVSFTVVRIPFFGQQMEPPYVLAQVKLDGADNVAWAVVGDTEVDDVRVGRRVEAVWVDPAERRCTMANLKWFRPLDEPDATVALPEVEG
jgi:uncharacterized OB-fold protein